MAEKKKNAPWDHPAPKSAIHHSLSPKQKQHAAARAKRAGRHYPNLVDNMHEAALHGGASKKATKRRPAAQKSSAKRGEKEGARKTPARETSGRKTSTRKTSDRKTSDRKTSDRKTGTRKTAARKSATRNTSRRQARNQDPKGGLTAAGRRMFHERQGSNLKPGVKKKASEMTREEMRRKGSWAARFYGRKRLPALQDASGKPTRFALSAAAWGERVPKTVTQARAIAARGRRLLEHAKRA